MDIEHQLRDALRKRLGTKSVPRQKLKSGRVEVTSGATYKIPMGHVANDTGIDVTSLSRFIHNRGSLSLRSAAKLAQYLDLKLTSGSSGN